MKFDIEYYDQKKINEMDSDSFCHVLKGVFDASIPWEDPKYDPNFQKHYLEHAEAMVVVRTEEKAVALSLAFTGECDSNPIIYIAGIWVDTIYKSQGLGRLIISSLIEGVAGTCFLKREKNIYIALRTQNAQIFEYFCKYYDVYPHPDKIPPNEVLEIADWVNEKFSKGKTYIREKMIIRKVFPKGIIVGHVHPAKNIQNSKFISENLDVLEGDSYILVMKYEPSFVSVETANYFQKIEA